MFFPHVKNLIFSEGVGACWQEDIAAVRESWTAAGDRWRTSSPNGSMQFIRQPARVLSIGLQLESGDTVWGDCLSVSFAGKSGRDQAIQTNSAREALQPKNLLAELQNLQGRSLCEVESSLSKTFSAWTPAIRFGVSHALVNAVASASHKLPCDVLQEALGSAGSAMAPALQGSCGSNWHDAVERMIVAGVEYLPQGQFENLAKELGPDGSRLFSYIDWLKGRIAELTPVSLSGPNARRVITLDFHGALGQVFLGKNAAIADYIERLTLACKPFDLHVESPVVEGNFDDQVVQVSELTRTLRARGNSVKIIADEWANSLEQIRILATKKVVDGIHIKMPDTGSLLESGRAVAICKAEGLFVLLGGSCTETATSARLAAHLAMATAPDALLVKPGISFDEGFSLITNELAMIQSLRAIRAADSDSQDSTKGNESSAAKRPATTSV